MALPSSSYSSRTALDDVAGAFCSCPFPKLTVLLKMLSVVTPRLFRLELDWASGGAAGSTGGDGAVDVGDGEDDS